MFNMAAAAVSAKERLVIRVTLKHIRFQTSLSNKQGAPSSTLCSSLAQETAVDAGVEGAPGSEALLPKELRSEIDIGLAIEKIMEIQAGAFEMDGVDLEISPVKCSV